MPDIHHYYKCFISAIQHKVANRARLANTITDLLAIDKDAVYRRLRGEVTFTFIEMATIAKHLGISLDSIAGIESEQSRPTRVVMTKHLNPTSVDYGMFSVHINVLKLIKDEPDTILMESGNALSYHLFYDYEYLTRLYLLGWSQASSHGDYLRFKEMVIPEQLRTLQKDCCYYARHIKSTHYVWDRMVFLRMVENIKFSAKIRLLNGDDIAALKNELTTLINHLEKLAIRGRHEDTGNEVSFYISDLNLETSYCCIKSENLRISLFKTFLVNSNASFDEEVYNEVSAWIYALRKMSVLISVSGEKTRADFFNTQRKIIDTL